MSSICTTDNSKSSGYFESVSKARLLVNSVLQCIFWSCNFAMFATVNSEISQNANIQCTCMTRGRQRQLIFNPIFMET